MNRQTIATSLSLHQLVVIHPEPAGHYTAQVVGLPEISATAQSRLEAIERVRLMLSDWVASGQLVEVEVPSRNPLLDGFGHFDPNDPNEQAYLEELERFRREDLERTLKEQGEECSDSSSTPTT